MTRKYVRKKLTKMEPNTRRAIEIVRCDEYLLLWRPPGASGQRRPKPQRWANLLVFLRDVERRKRSYNVAWNGERFAESAEALALATREPDVWADLRGRLERLDRVVCTAQAEAREQAREQARAARRGV